MTENEKRHNFRLTRDDLNGLKKIALQEHKNFFKRNRKSKKLSKAYTSKLFCIALCQGAAIHYIDHKNGIKDFDVWLFYKKDDKVNFPDRSKKSIENGYRKIRIDFIKRSIPSHYFLKNKRPDAVLLKFFSDRDPKRKNILKKAIIGLYPKSIFDTKIWINPEIFKRS
ncbi:MAG: hypothetical protein AAB911_01920 [Patescibacteria group bacterium]